MIIRLRRLASHLKLSIERGELIFLDNEWDKSKEKLQERINQRLSLADIISGKREKVGDGRSCRGKEEVL
ncbi:hypothetical protein LIER_11334 [Lithospermum erythrorhizon]|uniref:Uncharacterized protein n=1 Tax=Lithospermum erythrorhizon TaxID=34254 RepID=A0AAV3PML3_LITER